MLCILPSLFARYVRSPMPPRYHSWTQHWYYITDTSGIEAFHPPQKDSLSMNSQTTNLDMENEILLHVRFDALCALIWLGIIPILAVDTLLGISFKNCIIREIFSSKCKPVPWGSHPVSIFVSSKFSKLSKSTTTVDSKPTGNTFGTGTEVEKLSTPIHTARRALLQPHTVFLMIVSF